jgi:hypothetical protein
MTKCHLANLLERKRIFWKQRNTIRWVKFGDENISFFQALATQNHRRNFIVSLCTPDNSLITDHEQKANHIYESFRDRLGISEFDGIIFDMASLLSLHNLDDLDEIFTNEEIKQVIKSLPNDHAPGPDGFNGLFIKKSWPVIKNDFMRIFSDFCIGTLDSSSINNSHIALIPKKRKSSYCG